MLKHAANYGPQGQPDEIKATQTAKCTNMYRILVLGDKWQSRKRNEKNVWNLIRFPKTPRTL